MTQPLVAVSLDAALTVASLDASVAWYCTALGFEVDKQHEREGRRIAVSLKAGAIKVLLAQDDGAKGADRAKGEGISLQITTAQPAEEIAARIKATGTTLDLEPTRMPWGVTALRMRDPDGFRFTVSSTHNG
jgi:uncharacterized glyoxalase superfamily protein PhnB